jgi:hypothetical protein
VFTQQSRQTTWLAGQGKAKFSHSECDVYVWHVFCRSAKAELYHWERLCLT